MQFHRTLDSKWELELCVYCTVRFEFFFSLRANMPVGSFFFPKNRNESGIDVLKVVIAHYQ